MAFLLDHRHSSSGSDQSYHSATAEEDHWVHSKNIGAGGFGVVKLFVNQATREMIVLKECRLMNLSRETLERWYGEVEILKRLDHPNIVKAQNVPEGLNCSPMSNTPFICMEYCDGGDLRQVLRDPENCCGLPEKTIRQICHDVNQGIRFLHSQRVIHRDLKPENILIKKIDPNKVVYKLTDFGYAKSYDKSSVCTSLVGTVQYVAPEVLKDKKYHSSVDFWSFGMVVFECVTGKRPFLHGDPAVAIGWVDWVSKKGPKDIHIFWGEDEFKPVYSSKLPQPHRLCKPFEGHITSWLQTALHYNPDMRGGRRVATEDAPCLTNMDHILNTQMVNAVCTSTGDVNSFVITNSSLTMEDLRQSIQCSTSVPPSEQYLVLRNGHMPLPSDPVSMCIWEGDYNLGEVYVFTTALEPSFKMMHSTSHAVSTLTAYGDEQIKQDDRKDVYSHVFFHIREQYSLFHHLHCAHEAMLTQLTQQCREVTQEQEVLSHAHLRVEALTSFIKEMHAGDSERMRAIHAEHRALPPAILSRTLIMWDKNQEQLEQKTRFLRSLHSEIANIRLEADTLLQLSTDLQTCHTENEQRFHDYYKLYVVKARDIYQDTKLNRGYSTVGRMQDVLLGATQDAETIIRKWLNGRNFGQQFVALHSHLLLLGNKRNNILAAEREVTEINEKRRKDVWELLLHERKNTPFTSLTDIGQKSSVESSIELTDSLRRFSRCVSQEENDRVLEKNSQLLRRLSSLVESNGRSLDGEGGGAVNGGEGSITGSRFRQHSAPINARGSSIGNPQQRCS